MTRNLNLVFCLCLLLLSGCSTIPDSYEAEPSQSWPSPETTSLGEFFDEPVLINENHSGIALLPEGREAFIARYALAGQAEKTLDLQYYLWKGDNTGMALTHQVLMAADRGVKVRILMDDIYHSGRDQAYAALDQHPNIQIRLFNPIRNRGLGRWGNFLAHKSELNHRMHNKIFLVDNAVTIMGGRNIGDDYFGIDPNLIFHDLDVIAVGPVAQSSGAAFDEYWNSDKAFPISVIVSKEPEADMLAEFRKGLDDNIGSFLAKLPYNVPLEGVELQEALQRLEDSLTWAPAEIVVDPLERFDGGKKSAFELLGQDLNKAMTDEVVIQTAYLIPTQEGIEQIREGVARGINYRVMTNSLLSNNHITVHGHYQKYRKELLEAGVDLYELRADTELIEYYRQSDRELADSHAGLHTKAFVVDERYSMIGSYNMDPRSRIWNSEIGLFIDSPEFAKKVLEVMNRQFNPESAYRLSLDDKGKVNWTLIDETGATIWTKDPDSTAWKRFLARLIGWLPGENEL